MTTGYVGSHFYILTPIFEISMETLVMLYTGCHLHHRVVFMVPLPLIKDRQEMLVHEMCEASGHNLLQPVK